MVEEGLSICIDLCVCIVVISCVGIVIMVDYILIFWIVHTFSVICEKKLSQWRIVSGFFMVLYVFIVVNNLWSDCDYGGIYCGSLKLLINFGLYFLH